MINKERFLEIMETASAIADNAVCFEDVDNLAMINELAAEVLRLREGLHEIRNAGHRQVEDLMLIAHVTLGDYNAF